MLSLLFSSLKIVVLTFLVLGPITGIVLDGFSYSTHLLRPLGLALIAGALHVFIQLARLYSWAQLWSKFTAAWTTKPKRATLQDHQGGRDDQDGQASRGSVRGKLSAAERSQRKRLMLFAVFGAVAASMILPFLAGKYWITVLILVLIYVLLGLGLNVVVGLAGLLDLGFVGFYAVGAYGYALGHEYLGLSFWLAIPFGALIAGLFGIVLAFPVLKMHGDYLAIVTLGFGEIIRLVLNNWLDFTGGPNGVPAPFPTLFGIEFTRWAKQGGVPFHKYFDVPFSTSYRYIFLYFVLLFCVFFMVYVVHRLKNMPMGRAWEALREDEIACRSLGINHVNVKLSAFAIGAMVGGVAGVFFAGFQGFINPSSFTFFESAIILAIVVLGGMGSLRGVILAAIILTVLPEALRAFSEYRILIFGALMVMMMIWRPQGLVRASRPTYDLPSGDDDEGSRLGAKRAEVMV